MNLVQDDFIGRIRSRSEQRRRGSYLGARIGKGLCSATHDYNVANASGANVRADLNNVLAAIVTWNSGTTWADTFAYMRVVDTSASVVRRRNAANSGWILQETALETFVITRSSNTILAESDKTRVIRASSGYTQTFTAAATLGQGWWCGYIVDSGVTVVFDPNSTETINGATTLSIVGPAQGFIYCDSSAFYAMGFAMTATQADVEAASSSTVFVTPLRMQNHPGVAKFEILCDSSGNITVSNNITSITDTGAGEVLLTIATDFSSANYVVDPAIETTSALAHRIKGSSRAAGSVSIQAYSFAPALADPDFYHVAAYGDQ